MHYFRKEGPMKIKKSKYTITFDIIAYSVLTIVSVISVLPFLIILASSFSRERDIKQFGYSLWPRNFSLDAYNLVFKYPESLFNAYKITIFVTVVGTVIGLFFTCLTAYVLSRREFKYRNRVSFLIYFTTIFGGGMVPWYLTYSKILNLNGKLASLWFPGLMTPFLIILMRTFIQSTVPEAVVDSAKIDGAGHVKIFTNIVLPVMKPGLATVGLFLALGYWNDWYRCSLFIHDKTKYMLQFYLYDMLNQEKTIKELASQAGIIMSAVPSQTAKMAMAVIATGPILLLYPFIQKYFVAGMTVGAVKG